MVEPPSQYIVSLSYPSSSSNETDNSNIHSAPNYDRAEETETMLIVEAIGLSNLESGDAGKFLPGSYK